MPEPRRSTTKLVITGAVISVVVIVVIVIVATRGDDDSTSGATTTAGLVIQSPATVTGITGVGGAGEATSSTAVVPNTYPLVRSLVEPGKFDCTTLGSWKPFAEVPITLRVGQPAAGSTCGETVLDLPEGSCTDTCSAVPDDWEVREDPGVTPQALMMVVAPITPGATTAQFLCIKDSMPQIRQVLPVTTSIHDACLAATSNSIEIPYVPPVTSDIPYVPPPVSVDLPPATGR